jgi:type II secretion system protein G
MFSKTKKGFTLIELLVVIAIIGILSSIVLASLDSTRKRGRDSRRLSDIKQIQLALELYYDQNNGFPTCISNAPNSWQAGVTCAQQNLTNPGYISVVPTDPSGTNRDYNYTPYAAIGGSATQCISFHLGATLETSGHNSLLTDKDLVAQNGTGGSIFTICSGTGVPSADFNGVDSGKCNNLDFGVTCYDVIP